MPERRFDEKEVGQILSKAAAVQSGSSDPDSLRGITLEELQRVAQEVGLDPREIGRAAKSLESDRKVQRNRSANSVLLQQSVEGELSEEMWEQLVTAGRAFSGRAGRLVQNGATREWHSNEDAQTLLLSATTRNGRTQIRLLGDVSGAAILTTTFGSIFGIFASMAPMIYSTKQSAFVSPILTAVLTLLIVVTTEAVSFGLLKSPGEGQCTSNDDQRADIRALEANAHCYLCQMTQSSTDLAPSPASLQLSDLFLGG